MRRVEVSWEFYVEVYHGCVVEEADFARLMGRAVRVLDALTFGRIDRVYAACEDVKLACCAVMEVLAEEEAHGGQVVSRERLDAYEVAYQAEAGRSLKRRCLDAAGVYLWRTGLLSAARGW